MGGPWPTKHELIASLWLHMSTGMENRIDLQWHHCSYWCRTLCEHFNCSLPKSRMEIMETLCTQFTQGFEHCWKICINKINNRPFKCLPSGKKVDIKYTNELEEKLLKRFYRGLEPWPFRSHYALSKPLKNSASIMPNVDIAQSNGPARLWYDDPFFLPKLIAKNIANWTNLKTVDSNQTTLVKFYVRELTWLHVCWLERQLLLLAIFTCKPLIASQCRLPPYSWGRKKVILKIFHLFRD